MHNFLAVSICRFSTYSKITLEAFCLAIVGRKAPKGELAVLGLASADDKSNKALYLSLSFGSLDISCVDHLPEELIAVTIQGLSFSMAMGIGPEGTFQRMQLSLQNLQIDDQLSASRCVGCLT